ncbi:MAG TPA: hypothetical protein DDW27_08320 [Bacteroidales bacterium]|nr:hypothetical protein [Bacteroidales bacterium]
MAEAAGKEDSRRAAGNLFRFSLAKMQIQEYYDCDEEETVCPLEKAGHVVYLQDVDVKDSRD